MNYYGLTDVGRVRKQNEDTIFTDPGLRLFIVADGMGGHKGGEVASKMAVDRIVAAFRSALDSLENTEIQEFMFSAIRAANVEIRMQSFKDLSLRNMGTTIAIALIRDQILYACHVGDSRIYVINKNEIRQIGIDHSVVYQSVMEGEMTREEAWNSSMKNVLVQAIGSREGVVPEFHTVPLLAGDKILLCSDGLWDMLPDQEIHTSALSDEDPEKVCNLLFEKAMEAGGNDNISVIFIN